VVYVVQNKKNGEIIAVFEDMGRAQEFVTNGSDSQHLKISVERILDKQQNKVEVLPYLGGKEL